MLKPEPRQAVRVEPSLPDYFRRRLNRYAARLRPAPQEDTLWYLGEMMHRFSRSEHFFDYHDGHYGNRPLALLYGDAKAASNPRQRCLLFQRLVSRGVFPRALCASRHPPGLFRGDGQCRLRLPFRAGAPAPAHLL